MDTPAIAILMPAYNPGPYVVDAVESAVKQMNPGDVIYIQEGDSDDGWSAEIARRYPDFVDLRTEPDGGQSDALNRALGRAQAEWVGWLNADDLLLPGALDAVRRTIVSAPSAEVVYGDYALVDAEGRVTQTLRPGTLSRRDLLFGARMPFSGAIFIRTSVLREIGGFNGDFHYCMDYKLFLDLWDRLQDPQYVPVVLGALRIHPGTKTSDRAWDFVREARQIRKGERLRGMDRVRGGRATLKHAATVATTPLRATAIYARLRGRN